MTSQSSAELRRAFAAAFSGLTPQGVTVAPGRVNLIGDHTDYNGLPVFPMALDRTTAVAFRPREDSLVRMVPLTPGYGAREITLAREIEPFPVGDWGNYPKAALQSLVSRVAEPGGFDAVVTSDVPVAAGLSSSSALVVATALAFQETNGIHLAPLELAAELARGERYVGTQGGGMDQAVSLMSQEGAASLIRFDPLEVASVPVPPAWTFVVASSMVAAEKSGRAQQLYNRRTEECTEALERVCRALNPGEQPGSYRDLLSRAGGLELTRVASEVLDSPLMERFRHVVSEAERVEAAVGSMRNDDIVEFGRLMTESHCSLRDDYEVSCPELNDLVEIALESGAVGARLTGAGFGGCIVALASGDRATGVLEGLRSRFYKQLNAAAADQQLFVARPSAGARVVPA